MHERRFKKPLRYRGHDYRAPCIVHVTVCTHARQPLFGTVTPDGMQPSEPWQFVQQTLLDLHSDDLGIAIDTHIVMPDHVHAVIVLGTNPHVQATDSIPDLVRRFKMRILRAWPRGIAQHGWPRYDTHLALLRHAHPQRYPPGENAAVHPRQPGQVDRTYGNHQHAVAEDLDALLDRIDRDDMRIQCPPLWMRTCLKRLPAIRGGKTFRPATYPYHR